MTTGPLEHPLQWVSLALGAVLVVSTGMSLLGTLVLPRAQRDDVARNVERVVRAALSLLARLRRGYEGKDAVLALHGPLALAGMLVTWLCLLLVGWTMVLWAVTEGSIGDAAREAGSSMFTLGFASRNTWAATIADFLASASGLLVVALLIAYLPVLYAAFTRREALVTMLQSRAGVPAWGPEILARHQSVGLLRTLGAFYVDWERWIADVAESHTTYPILVSFRSPHALRSWVTSLLAVLDAAALQHALQGEQAPSQARLCLRMGFTALRDIADVLGIPYDPDPSPDDGITLSYEAFCKGVDRVEGTGFPMMRTREEAWPHFQGWRVNYESIAYAIADMVTAPPAPWSGPRHGLRGATITPIVPVDRRPGGDTRRTPAPDPHA
ncbi:MAG TPA: hypothetical protein VNU01_04780 [Egibacteraceae bacterium]|nr:hypothetical protein [Egibacteraceae bacterium]